MKFVSVLGLLGSINMLHALESESSFEMSKLRNLIKERDNDGFQIYYDSCHKLNYENKLSLLCFANQEQNDFNNLAISRIMNSATYTMAGIISLGTCFIMGGNMMCNSEEQYKNPTTYQTQQILCGIFGAHCLSQGIFTLCGGEKKSLQNICDFLTKKVDAE